MKRQVDTHKDLKQVGIARKQNRDELEDIGSSTLKAEMAALGNLNGPLQSDPEKRDLNGAGARGNPYPFNNQHAKP